MFYLALILCVTFVAANAVRIHRRGPGALALACVLATVLVALAFAMPSLFVRPSRDASYAGYPVPNSNAPLWFGFVPAAFVAGAGFLALGALATRRARRTPDADGARLFADLILGGGAWVAGAALGGLVAAVTFIVLIAAMAP